VEDLQVGDTVEIVTGAGLRYAVGVYMHSDYSRDAGETNDVAVLRTADTIPTRIAPVISTNDLTPFEPAIIAGFGKDEVGDIGRFLSGYVLIHSSSSVSVKATYFGAGSTTCSGDSGGPLFVLRNGEWTLAAVTSGGSTADCVIGDTGYYAPAASASNMAFIRYAVPELP
jgi:secreted trypsin-like serine protease